MEQIIMNVCMKFTSMGYQISPNVPQKKEQNARGSYKIPNNEQIYALIDGTLTGNAKNGIAVCTTGLYWNNAWMTKTNKTYLPWSEFVNARITKKEGDIQLFEGVVMGTLGYFGDENILKLLYDLQGSLRSAMVSQPSRPVSAPPAAPAPKTAPPPPPSSVKAPPPPPAPGKPAEVWTFAFEGNQVGSFTLEEIANRINSQELNTSKCFIWKKGLSNWIRVEDNEELAELLSDSSCPPPPF